MPFESDKQMRFMFSQNPKIAAKMVIDAKAAKKPVVKSTKPKKKKKG
jgi:hypothetical protein